jgi:hypothetical protein
MKLSNLVPILAAIALPRAAAADTAYPLGTAAPDPVLVSAAPLSMVAADPGAAPAAHHDLDHDRSYAIELGVAAGGAPLLSSLDPTMPVTTAPRTAAVFARFRLPHVSPRAVEVFDVPGYGTGVDLQNEDLHFGRVHLHLLDVGVFHDSAPITVARVARTWDLMVGTGARIDVGRHVSLTADWRMFVPLDMWSVLSQYGDSTRLIASEAIRGGQLWGGVSYRW